MKKILTLLLLVLISVTSVAQTVTLVFTGSDDNNQYRQLNRVEISNLTKGWQETIYFPDTVLTMQNSTGISENIGMNVFGLSQNIPNPFSGTTDVLLTVSEINEVTLEVTDVAGRTIAISRVVPQQNCIQQFRINLSSPGMYFLSAKQNGKVSSVKMVNNSVGNSNSIELKETRLMQSLPSITLTKGSTTNPFSFGDDMEYVGYANIGDVEVESQHIHQAQNESETFVLQFLSPTDGQPCPGSATVRDWENNEYNTVQIGNQCWMKDNLRSAFYADGEAIPLCETRGSAPQMCNYYPNGDITTVQTFGFLYNWYAAVRNAHSSNAVPSGVQGACPNGWHLPSDAEWDTLTVYLSSRSMYLCNDNSDYIAKSLAATSEWMTDNGICTIGNVLGDNDAAHFNALPAGYREGDVSYDFTRSANYWTSTESAGSWAFFRGMSYDDAEVGIFSRMKENAMSIRCVKGSGSPTVMLPTITTSPVTDITATTATGGGNVINDGGAPITARGICWSTSNNPTIADAHTTDGTGPGTFISSMTDLTPNTVYYVRAYATNSAGTSYGYYESFMTLEPAATLPTVSTLSVADITENSASCGGNVTEDGGATVTARGVCWSTSANPTVADAHTTDGSGTGIFTSLMTGLTENTQYYVRAYATNSEGTVYGNEVSFTTTAAPTATLPTVTTGTVNTITTISAFCGGNVSDDGGADVTARGVCWSTSATPTVTDAHTTDGTGIGAFNSIIIDLTANTTYHVRAYATNSVGTAYGNEGTFTTLNDDGIQPCPNKPILFDVDANVYSTVLIGNQCWMRENLKTTRYADGETITHTPSYTSTTIAYRYFPGNYSLNVETYGYLYNWKAAVRNPNNSGSGQVQGVCPDGWHLPSSFEWTQMSDYVNAQSEYLCNGVSTYNGKALASTTNWTASSTTCSVGNNQSTNNATGFTAMPAGAFGSDCNEIGKYAYFWSSSLGSLENTATCRGLSFNAWDISSGLVPKSYGYSVRCVYNTPGDQATTPTIITLPIINVTTSTAVCPSQVLSDGGAALTARGICWSTSPNPSLADAHTTDGTAIGISVGTALGLAYGTTYYVRAYATNSQGTEYGNQMTFTTPNSNDGMSCPGVPTVTDYDNNTYNTVQIGHQCWMQQNLKTTHYADGTTIPLSDEASTSVGYRFNPNDNASSVATYGYLYNWPAVMGSSSSSSSNPSGAQGICPNGWHVPSLAEWTQLTDYVSGQGQYHCGDNATYIAKALASTTGWDGSDGSDCSLIGNLSTNNATGFSALGAGYFSYGSSMGFGTNGYFWTSTATASLAANYVNLYSFAPTVYLSSYTKDVGYSVRCVLNEFGNELPTVTTASVTNVTTNTASCGGNVTDNGGAAVTARGVCWSTSQNPTIGDSHTSDGTGLGSFNSAITGLEEGTTYYVRAYAINLEGAAYGNQQSFTTAGTGPATLPVVTTASVTNITSNSATCGGNVIDNAGVGISARGVCWSTSQNPTISNDHTVNGNGAGNFTSSMTGLSGNTTYYVRAYATSVAGTVYGQEESFLTLPSEFICGVSVLLDADNNSYNTVQIGNQCWMADNLKTTKYADGTSIPVGTSTSTTVGYYYYPANNYGNFDTYGLLYNWKAVMRNSNATDANPSGVQGICPDGWHIPSDAEWTQLTDFVSANSQFWCGNSNTKIAKALCANSTWATTTTTCAPGNQLNTNNSTGFSAIPAGIYAGSYMGLNTQVVYWSTTLYNDKVYYRYINRDLTNVVRNPHDKYYANSVRCVKDEQQAIIDGQACIDAPTVTDPDGNVYTTVQIGNQCWMKENLRTSKYADGSIIADGSSTSSYTAYKYCPNNSSNVATYGYLYNWQAVIHNSAGGSSSNPSGLQGICPNGWHVPSDAEWSQLETYLESQNQFVCGNEGINVAKAMASTTGWDNSTETCAVGNDQSANNTSGFSALPAGRYNGAYNLFGSYANFWSATQGSSPYAYEWYINASTAYTYRIASNRTQAFSVRCVKN